MVGVPGGRNFFEEFVEAGGYSSRAKTAPSRSRLRTVFEFFVPVLDDVDGRGLLFGLAPGARLDNYSPKGKINEPMK